MAKADNIEMEKRMTECVRLVVRERFTRAEFMRYCAEKWNLASRQSEVYWARVHEYMKEKNDKTRDKMVLEQIERYQELYDLCIEKKDYQTAKGILADINKMKGLNEAEKKDITSNGESIKIIIGVDEDDD